MISVAPLRPKSGDRHWNLHRLAKLAQQAVQESSFRMELIVFPELATTGVIDKGPSMVSQLVGPVAGPTTRVLAELAKEHGVYIVVGLIEATDSKLYNSAALIGPKGVVGKYRKLHLARADKSWASPGDLGLPVFDLPIGRVGLLIGYDSMSPESARCLAAAGVDLICIPAAVCYPRVQESIGRNPTSNQQKGAMPHWRLWRERARENNVYVAFANQCGQIDGKSFIGSSGIFSPDDDISPLHEIILPLPEDAVDSMSIDTSILTSPPRAKPYLRMRRPEWSDLIL